MIKVITIDREYGSGAADIAATLAAPLVWKLWDELLTIEMARITGCDCPAVEEREERLDSFQGVHARQLQRYGECSGGEDGGR
jgi:hypothetical protein